MLFVLGLVIARAISFSRYTGPLKVGRDLVAAARAQGLAAYVARTGEQAHFLVTDKQHRPIGFAAEFSSHETQDPNFSMSLAGIVHLSDGRSLHRQLTLFESDETFECFRWRMFTSGVHGNSGTEILRGADGEITVTESGGRGSRWRYSSSAAVIPTYVLDLVFDHLLDRDVDRAIIEAVDSQGRMVEVVVSQADRRRLGSLPAEIESVLKVEFLDQRQFSQIVYLDREGKVVRLEQPRMQFERVTEKQLLEYFPEWEELILEKKQMLEKEQL
jgi:hypothetical protein